jgi:tetrahydromethanopterin S-methyltransferase subunit A
MTTVRKKIDDAAGKICEVVLPIKHEYYLGRGDGLAICTLASIDLLEEISKSETIMDRVAIAGRLLSENKGIDAMIRFTLEHPKLARIIVCGKDVKGHRAGQALLSLYKNGIDSTGRIIGAAGPYPTLKSTAQQVESFRKQVVAMVEMIGTADVARIAALVA